METGVAVGRARVANAWSAGELDAGGDGDGPVSLIDGDSVWAIGKWTETAGAATGDGAGDRGRIDGDIS